MHHPEPTRTAGEARLATFAPRMGADYAKGRNVDAGPGAHRNVSGLSPYIRRRLVLERDAVAAALASHGPQEAARFIEEIIWRGYFKGWLEHRPQVWASYRDGLLADLAALETDRPLRLAVARAEAGETGLACFDAWARELVESNHLHNHARMWFASIWIFTFRLPWRIGADFFFRHLLDGDPASNTLGWRWVAGLHTRGKPYAAQADNIARFTNGRFAPRAADLATDVTGLHDDEPMGLPPLHPLRLPRAPDPGLPSMLLLTEEDCRPEDFAPLALNLRGVLTLETSHLRSPRPVADAVARFEDGALADAGARLGLPIDRHRAGLPSDLARHAARLGARQIVTSYVPRGPLHDWLNDAAPALAAANITLTEWQRDWDAQIWPHAKAGFFKVKRAIPAILHRAGLDQADGHRAEQGNAV